MNPILELILIAIFGLCGKLAENMRGLNSLRDKERNDTIATLYNCFNLHLSISIGAAILVWNSAAQGPKLVSIVLISTILIFSGALFRGFVSDLVPERLHYRDKVARYGLFIPNGFAIASIAFAGLNL